MTFSSNGKNHKEPTESKKPKTNDEASLSKSDAYFEQILKDAISSVFQSKEDKNPKKHTENEKPEINDEASPKPYLPKVFEMAVLSAFQYGIENSQILAPYLRETNKTNHAEQQQNPQSKTKNSSFIDNLILTTAISCGLPSSQPSNDKQEKQKNKPRHPAV